MFYFSNIVKYLDDFHFPNGTHYIVMEYCSFGSLDEMVFNIPNTEKNIWEIIKQLANALSHLHSKEIIHGDIKPENVLLSKEGHSRANLKLADFGSSWDKYFTHNDTYEARYYGGTEGYFPPEVLKNETFDKSADIWSFGATIVLVCNWQLPFVTKEEIITWTGNYTPIYNPSRYSADLHLLIMAMLNPEPERRPTAETIYDIASKKFVVTNDFL